MNLTAKTINLPSVILFSLFFCAVECFGQDSQLDSQDSRVDSLKTALKQTTADTSKVNILNQIAVLLYGTEQDEAIAYGMEAKMRAEKIGYKRGVATAYKNIGMGHYLKTEYKEALQNWETALLIYEELGDERLMANILSNVGAVFSSSGVYDQALENYLRALGLAEELEDSLGVATLNMNIGLVYAEQAIELDLAKNYYLKAIDLADAIGSTVLVGEVSINLGEVYFAQNNYDTALYYYERSILFLTNELLIAASLNKIGLIYIEKGDYEKAIKYQQDALEVALRGEAKLVIPDIYSAMASIWYRQGNISKAIRYYQQARSYAEDLGLMDDLMEAYQGLAETYAAKGDYASAYNYLHLQDTLDNAANKLEKEDKTTELMFSYQMEKKQHEIMVLEQAAEIDELKSRRQRGIIFAIGLFGVLLLFAAVAFYNRMRFIRETNKKINAQKDEIESQRDEIESQRDKIQLQHDLVYSQKKLITDSISYAQRIQAAMLPSEDLLDILIPEHFVVFKPKDIVSGDFYWAKEVMDHVVIVGADCTGHGVPGGFMSMLGMTLLDDLINDRCFNAPSAILEQLRVKIKGMLVQNGDSKEAKDGMDMALAILNKNNRELHFAGANSPIYIVRDKKIPAGKDLEPHASMEGEDYLLYEIKGDRQPIGVHWEETSFRTHSIMLREDDTFYLFSDGIADQFGGEQRKKFKTRHFKKLLLSIQHENMKTQGKIIENAFENWKGNVEQIDDVFVVGVKV